MDVHPGSDGHKWWSTLGVQWARWPSIWGSMALATMHAGSDGLGSRKSKDPMGSVAGHQGVRCAWWQRVGEPTKMSTSWRRIEDLSKLWKTIKGDQSASGSGKMGEPNGVYIGPNGEPFPYLPTYDTQNFNLFLYPRCMY